MAIYQIIGKSGFVYIGHIENSKTRSLASLELGEDIGKTTLEDCIIIHPINDKNSSIANYLFSSPENLLRLYDQFSGPKNKYDIHFSAVESHRKLKD